MNIPEEQRPRREREAEGEEDALREEKENEALI